jgi:hypothetical protein
LQGIDPTALASGLDFDETTEDSLCVLTQTLLAERRAFFSLWTQPKNCPQFALCSQKLTSVVTPNVTAEDTLRCELFREAFEGIQGLRYSNKDREAIQSSSCSDLVDDQSLAYGEIVSVSDFSAFLTNCGAIDGQIFYDLGSGVGKALIGAALSGICFLKCIGIEVLPQLAETSRGVIARLAAADDSQEGISSASRLAMLRDQSTLSQEEFLDRDGSDNLLERLNAAKITLPLLEIRYYGCVTFNVCWN